MKKARILLSSIAIVGLVGGAMAFSTSRGLLTVFTYDSGANTCNAVGSNYTFAITGTEAQFPSATTDVDATCTNPLTVYAE